MRAAAVAIAVGLLGCTRPDPRPPAPPAEAAEAAPAYQRGLTAGEVALLRPLFGDSVDYPAVLVIDDHFTPLQGDQTYMTPQGSIYAPGALFRDDFAAPAIDPWVQAVFVHELVHVWQYQSGLDPILASLGELARFGGDYQRAYPYTLIAGRDLLDYGLEQEASIVEDYWLLQTHGIAPARLENPPRDPDERDALYASVLGTFLADPAYAKAIGPDELLRRHRAIAPAVRVGAGSCAADDGEHAARHLCSWRFPPAE